ncbi:hypothetical protein B0T17DRAFT_620894 [Bombardia bombarda]|uniref:Uncharacterized protein n=1 Tax=Bombardia bombarda TaxID=252184 RepID=A0AA39U2I9_9PEZI|nr:hypothetical protein B0T17DRAFT_620894 [Bombardia bombarda]
MTDPDPNRPGSSAAAHHASSTPHSRRPSVASHASRSSLRRERDRQEALAHARPLSAAYSHPHSPQQGTPTGPAVDEPSSSLTQQQPDEPPFTPLFTLLTSNTHPSHRQTTYHPTVHYIFADDDPDLMTAALAQHIEDNDNQNERAVVLDMAPTPDGAGLEVAWASSLSPDWAVVSASVSHMKDNDGAAERSYSLPGTLVLKIDGVSIEPSAATATATATAAPLTTSTPELELQSSGASGTRQQSSSSSTDDYARLLVDFDQRMGLLHRVVEVGAERQRMIEAEQQNNLEQNAGFEGFAPAGFEDETGGA